jgi:hypothetical protein
MTPSPLPPAPTKRRPPALLLALTALAAGLVTPALGCVGDCNFSRTVSVDELVLGVGMALGSTPIERCAAFDRSGDGRLSVEELVAAVGNALNGCSGQTDAFVITTNFMAGSFATIGLDEPRQISGSTAQRRVHSDAVVRTRNGLVYVVNRRFADNIQVLDPSSDFRTLLQCSTGNGTNPHDIAFAGDGKAYVTLFEERELLIVNPHAQPDCKDFVRGAIDLGALADADGTPDMDLMAVVGDRLYVSVQRLDINSVLRLPAGRGALAVIDTASDTLIDTIELSGENPFAATKGLTVRAGKLYIAQAGRFGVMDGGIERVDLASGQPEGFFVTEEDLGGDVTDFVLVSEHLAYAIVSRRDFSTALVAFDPLTATVVNTLLERDGYTLFDLELNDRGELFLTDRARQRNGVHIFRATDGAALTSLPIDVGLTPFEVVFIP